MAKVDITGLLTGLAGTPDLEREGITRASAIQSRGLGSDIARGRALRAPQREQRMRQAAGGLFGIDTRTAGQKVKEQLGQLDITKPAGQEQAVQLVAQIDPTRALALRTRFTEENKAETLKQSTQVKEQKATKGFAEYIRKIDPDLGPLALSGKLTPANMKDFLPELADKERYMSVGGNIFDTWDSVFISGPNGATNPKDNLITVDGRLYNALDKKFVDLPPETTKPLEEERLYDAVKAANDAAGLPTPVLGAWLDRNKTADNRSPDKKIWDELKAANDAASLPTPTYGAWYNSNNVETDTVERTDPITGVTTTSVYNKKSGEVIRELGVTGLPKLEIVETPDGKYRVNNLSNGVRGELVDTPEAAQLKKQQMEQTQNGLFALDEILAKVTKAKKLGEGEGGIGGMGAAGRWGAYSILSRIAIGTDSKELAGIIKSLQANLGFKELQEMRKNSPTGGALGSVSNLEIGLLVAAVTSLDPGMGVETFNEQLDLVSRHYDNFKRGLMGMPSKVDYNSEEYAGFMVSEENPNNNLSVLNGEFVLRDADGAWYKSGVKVKEKK